MKKALIAVVVAAGAGCVIAPKFIANTAQTKLDETITAIDNIEGYSLTLRETKPGWFYSHNILDFAVDLTELAKAPSKEEQAALAELPTLAFEILVDMQHGPILGTNRLGLVGWQARVPHVPEGMKLLGDDQEALYEMEGKTGLLSGMSFHDNIAAFIMEIQEAGATVRFSGFKGHAKSVGDQIHYLGDASSLSIAGPGSNVLLKDFSLDWVGSFDLDALQHGFYEDTNFKMTADKLSFEQGGNLVTELQQLSMYANTVANDDKSLDMSLGYSTEDIQTPLADFDKLELKMAFNNISAEFLAEYQSQASNIGDVANIGKFMQAMQQPTIDALAFQPTFSIENLGIKNSDGELSSSATLRLKEYDVPAEKLSDPSFWQQNVLIESSVSIPKSMALSLGQQFIMNQMKKDPSAANIPEAELKKIAQQQVTPLLNSFKQQGIFVEKGDSLTVSFNYEDGQTKLNGKAAAIPGMPMK